MVQEPDGGGSNFGHLIGQQTSELLLLLLLAQGREEEVSNGSGHLFAGGDLL
jgi:hypothetical protein